MSIEALNWALTQMQNPDFLPSVRFVLMFLANRAGPEGDCYPSVNYIRKHTGLADSTIREAYKQLEDAGLMEVTLQIRENGGKSTNLFKMNLPPPPPPPIGGTHRRRSAEPPPPTGDNTKVVNERGSKEPTLKPSEKDQGQNQPAGKACAKCGKETTGGTTRMRIGDVCNACREDYMSGKWKLEAAA